MLSVFMGREKVEHSIFEEELVLWGTKIHPMSFDRTFCSEDSMEYDTPKRHQKEDWEIGSMEEGEHPFPFELDLPAKSMPSSIDVVTTPSSSNSSLGKDQLLIQFVVFINDRRASWAQCEIGLLRKRIFLYWISSMSWPSVSPNPSALDNQITRRRAKRQER